MRSGRVLSSTGLLGGAVLCDWTEKTDILLNQLLSFQGVMGIGMVNGLGKGIEVGACRHHGVEK